MKRLRIKHLSTYLPYRLYYRLKGNYPIKEGVDNIIENFAEVTIQNIHIVLCDVNRKPILRPLSDLVKEINIQGDIFVPMERIFGLNYINWDGESQSSPLCIRDTYNCSNGTVTPEFIPYWVVENLLKWHFDIFGLIEEGLAVDYNCLTITPTGIPVT